MSKVNLENIEGIECANNEIRVFGYVNRYDPIIMYEKDFDISTGELKNEKIYNEIRFYDVFFGPPAAFILLADYFAKQAKEKIDRNSLGYKTYSFTRSKLKDNPLIRKVLSSTTPRLVEILSRIDDHLSRAVNDNIRCEKEIIDIDERTQDRVDRILKKEVHKINVYLGSIEEAEKESGKKLEPVKIEGPQKFIEARNDFELKLNTVALRGDAIVNYRTGSPVRGTPVKFAKD